MPGIELGSGHSTMNTIWPLYCRSLLSVGGDWHELHTTRAVMEVRRYTETGVIDSA